MIHYHGCPLSGPCDQAGRFFRGRHAMVSFANPSSLPMVSDVAQSFALDNGAFSVWRSGGRLDLEGFASWVDEWKRHPGYDWHLIPDVIGGAERENDALIWGWVTRSETHDANPVPVWHMHESLQKLRVLAGAFRRVAIGSSGPWPNPGTRGWRARMAEAMAAIVDGDGRPMCKLHGLRMLAPKIFTQYPFASADSTNAAVNAGSVRRWKGYCPPQPWQRANHIAESIEAHNSSPVWVARELQGVTSPGLFGEEDEGVYVVVPLTGGA